MTKVLTDEGILLTSELAKVADFFKSKETQKQPDPVAFNPEAYKVVAQGMLAKSVKK